MANQVGLIVSVDDYGCLVDGALAHTLLTRLSVHPRGTPVSVSGGDVGAFLVNVAIL
jgi:uncharacterized protein YwbE